MHRKYASNLEKLQEIDIDDTFFVIISKSGDTIETISLFKYFNSLKKIDNSNGVIISGKNTQLTRYAINNNIKTFDISDNLSGRFSVFSAVGLVPLCLVGVDIDMLLKGVKDIKDRFFHQGEFCDMIMEKARFMVENKHRFNINVLFSYSSSLLGFNNWYVQLWGESLGKVNKNGTRQALTPISLIGPIDQHSFLQLLVDGKRDKTVTFIKIADFQNEIVIPKNSLDGFDELDYIDGYSFSSMIENQADATIKVIQDLKDVPCDVITIKHITAYDIASLMYSYQLLTSVIGAFVQINTYNQPGVQEGKIILKDKLKNKFK
jgi:glucose-6-phosphate isomerase